MVIHRGESCGDSVGGHIIIASHDEQAVGQSEENDHEDHQEIRRLHCDVFDHFDQRTKGIKTAEEVSEKKTPIGNCIIIFKPLIYMVFSSTISILYFERIVSNPMNMHGTMFETIAVKQRRM